MIFTAGVADVTMYDGDQLLSTSRTMIDTAIAISTSAEEVRAGTGAKLFAKYYHSSMFEVTLNDQMFRMEYIAKNVGGTISIGGDSIIDEKVTLTGGGAGAVVGTPVDFNGFGTIGWATKQGEENWQQIEFTGQAFSISGADSGDVYCVKYFYTDDAAKKLIIPADIIPAQVTLYMKAKLFNGNPDKIKEATHVGWVTIKVPRFLLTGNQDLTMNMTGLTSTNLSGHALAYGGGCGQDDYYAEIIESIFDAKWYDTAVGLKIEDADFELTVPATKTLVVYAIFANAVPKKINNSELTFVSTETGVATVGASTGIVTAVADGSSTIRVKVTAKPAVEGVAYVTVDS
jgi:hypothetical protein